MRIGAPRGWLLVGALLVVGGLGLAATVPVERANDAGRAPAQVVAGVLLLVGWIVLGLGIHRFGRDS